MGRIADRRRQEILHAAIEVFGDKGFHRAKMGDIASRAGIGKGTIYEYFSSKNELYEEMLKDIVDGYLKGAEDIFKTSNSIRDRLIEFARYHGGFMGSHVELAENSIREAKELSDSVKLHLYKRKKDFLSAIYSLLIEGINNGEIVEELDVESASCLLLGGINQAYINHLHKEGSDSCTIDPAPVIEMVFKGIGKG
ncbi:TetR/AcrR family transcriptional regulator [Gudongella oleilytica]|jgi:AcrR family transcriptional regulator|uniref:TetR/AcrR family transcriptional regulator n=1 Tax=Gudongella oleilytica TaxID=1582259 RepID=UPI002A3677A0|nr:TetR/AcrR family transcriptional regulator [Gudongella oleilytica]MDY0255875.1 TetR/AcrR family transcriptional regulator [Gudongella oleilytica]